MPAAVLPPTPVRPPALALLALEPLRAALEYGSYRRGARAGLPRGDGHPVVLFPGLASDARALGPLTALCRELGYDTLDWGRGFNTGPHGDPDDWIDALARELVERLSGRGPRASLVGWSLGGIFAREIARRVPGRIRQVVTIGTPFAGSPGHTHASGLYRLLNGSPPAFDDTLRRRLAAPPPVPSTSIYSRSDGVVAWQACVQRGGARQCESVEVGGSHCGMGWNTEVFAILADRLAQPDGQWRPWTGARRAARRDAGRGVAPPRATS